MPKPTIPPMCRYHRDTLMSVVQNEVGQAGVYAAQTILDDVLQRGRGYTFNVYECPKCTYIEFHDNAPK